MPLRAKLLIPFLSVMVASALMGTLLLTRDARRASDNAATGRLTQVADQARSVVSDERASLLETARLAARTSGVADAIKGSDSASLTRTLPQLLINDGHSQMAVINLRGTILMNATDKGVTAASGAVREEALLEPTKTKVPFAGVAGTSLIVSTPVIDGKGFVVGAIIVSDTIEKLAAAIGSESSARITLFNTTGVALASAGGEPLAFRLPNEGLRVTLQDRELHALYAPLSFGETSAGTIAIALTSRQVGASSSPASAMAILLALVVILVVWIGIIGARLVTGPIGRLVASARSLGAGNLSARATVHGRDEVGRLAEAFNAMADDLQASYEGLEKKVADRTAELRRANEELAQVSEAKSRFLTGVSHELKTPLNAIIGFSSLLADPKLGRMPGKDRRRMAQNIESGGRHLLTIISELLDLATIEAGRMRIDAKPVDVSKAVAEAVELVQPLAAERGITVTVRRQRGLLRVVADHGRLRQVLINLLSNAIKYSGGGATVTLGATNVNGFVQVSVGDNGPGMTAAEAERIFSPFERGAGATKAEGTGVGLPLARQLVELHGGRMWVKSAPRKGSTFYFTLPTVELVSAAGDAEDVA